jgi:L-iditol 2-dehydrogenase
LTVRQVVFEGQGRLAIADGTPAALTPGGARVAVEACGICGTDIATLLRGEHALPGQVMGHEAVGIVTELGPDVRGLADGDRVVIRPLGACRRCWYCRRGEAHLCGGTADKSLGFGVAGAFADEVLIPEAAASGQVIRIDPATSIDDAVWTEPFAVALHAVVRGRVLPGERVLVTGAGPIGLAIVAAAGVAGASVEVIEPREGRRAAALALGAERAEAPGESAGGRVDVVLDASGASVAASTAVSRLGPGGRLVLVGLGDGPVPDLPAGVPALGAFAFTPREFLLAARLIESGRVRLGGAISHWLGLDDTAAAIELAASDPTALKVVIRP